MFSNFEKLPPDVRLGTARLSSVVTFLQFDEAVPGSSCKYCPATFCGNLSPTRKSFPWKTAAAVAAAGGGEAAAVVAAARVALRAGVVQITRQ